MIKVAITGNIASGKSTVQNILIQKGFKVLDTDDVAHKLLNIKNTPLFELFKPYDVFCENGEFSRDKIGRLVFSNKSVLLELESIMHPQISAEIENFFLDNKFEDVVFVGIPLLFEANMDNLFDKILFVYANDDIRLERLIERNNYSSEYAKIRLDAQISQDEKLVKSDFVIYNNSSNEDLKVQVFEFLDKILA